MTYRWLALALMLPASPTLAGQIPTPQKEPHICDVKYDPNDVLNIVAIVDNTVTIRFADTERIIKVAVSDHDHLRFDVIEGSNILWIKAIREMPTQPISVRTVREDGKPRDYILSWTALDIADKPQKVEVASNEPVKVSEDTTPRLNLCYLIRYNYGNEPTAVQIADWRAKQAKKKAEEAEIALRAETASRAHNNHYVGIGDASIGPSAPPGQDSVWDDGYTTTMLFPGNTRIPVILTRTADGHEAEVSGFTVEQGGMVKIHQTAAFFQLRDNDQTLCIYNRAYSMVGINPGTGTTSSTITRGLNE